MIRYGSTIKVVLPFFVLLWAQLGFIPNILRLHTIPMGFLGGNHLVK